MQRALPLFSEAPRQNPHELIVVRPTTQLPGRPSQRGRCGGTMVRACSKTRRPVRRPNPRCALSRPLPQSGPRAGHPEDAAPQIRRRSAGVPHPFRARSARRSARDPHAFRTGSAPVPHRCRTGAAAVPQSSPRIRSGSARRVPASSLEGEKKLGVFFIFFGVFAPRAQGRGHARPRGEADVKDQRN